jgi:acyl-CoA thioesterase-1
MTRGYEEVTRWAQILFLLFVTSAVSAAEKTILVLGDSLSAGYGLKAGEGWVDLLATRLKKEAPQWRVENASISGDTTGNGLQRLPGALASHQPEVVIIELGGNDGLRGMPPQIIKANLRKLIQQAAASGAKVLLMEMMIPPNYGDKYLQRFIGQYRELSTETGAVLVPFFLAEVGTKNEYMQPDGIHPNAKGQPKMLDAVWPHLKAQLR